VTPSPSTFDRARLGALTKLGGGGQGDVYRAPNVRISFAASAAFKEYKPAWRGKVDFSALEAMAAFLGGRSFTEGSELVERVAWPTKIVTDAGASVGFLMPEVPAEFLVPIALPSGARQSVLAGFQLLLNPPSYLARLGISVTERDRYLLLAEIAESLALFHRYDIAVGDLSPKNVLFSLTPSPRCFFVDADAMRLAGRGAMDQAETPDWEISTVSSEELATLATDRYKLGLLVLRLLAGDQSTRDPSALPPSVPADVRDLLVRSLSANPSPRLAPSAWVGPLRSAAVSASTAVPVPAKPAQAVAGLVGPASLPSVPQAPAVLPHRQQAYVPQSAHQSVYQAPPASAAARSEPSAPMKVGLSILALAVALGANIGLIVLAYDMVNVPQANRGEEGGLLPPIYAVAAVIWLATAIYQLLTKRSKMWGLILGITLAALLMADVADGLYRNPSPVRPDGAELTGSTYALAPAGDPVIVVIGTEHTLPMTVTSTTLCVP